jgi:hypothetical protein
MATKNPITGVRFGMLVVITDGLPNRRVLARCDCGNETTPFRSNVLRGLTSSCGCLRKSLLDAGQRRTHGLTKTPTHNVWVRMRRRCDDESHDAYRFYGGRGISVCERWSSFANFLADMGERPAGMSIERRNTNGNYEPSNCYWATKQEQMRNKRNSYRWKNGPLSFETLKDAAEHFGISPSRVHQLARVGANGWSREHLY